MQTRNEKEQEVAALREKLERANSVLIVDYRGLTVAEANDLRSRIREQGEGHVEYRVAKNTLLRRAIDGTDAAAIDPYLKGPTAVALAYDEPSAVAKVLVDFAKQNEKLEIKGGMVEGEVLDLSGIRTLAELPSREELRGMLAGTIQAPLRNLAGTLHALLGHVRNALEQRQTQLEAAE